MAGGNQRAVEISAGLVLFTMFTNALETRMSCEAKVLADYLMSYSG